MQTRAQSTLETFVDFLCSILVNVVGQVAIYGKAATAGRVTFFSSLFLSIVFVRRFATRRFFESITTVGMRQSRVHSIVETVSDTLLGFVIAIVLQLLIYGDAATLIRASLLTLGLYGLTMVRRYVLRRFFAALAVRKVYTGALNQALSLIGAAYIERPAEDPAVQLPSSPPPRRNTHRGALRQGLGLIGAAYIERPVEDAMLQPLSEPASNGLYRSNDDIELMYRLSSL